MVHTRPSVNDEEPRLATTPYSGDSSKSVPVLTDQKSAHDVQSIEDDTDYKDQSQTLASGAGEGQQSDKEVNKKDTLPPLPKSEDPAVPGGASYLYNHHNLLGRTTEFFDWLEKERRADRLDTRLVQAMYHEKLSHARILQLEQSVQELEAVVYNKEQAWVKTEVKRKFPAYNHVLHRSVGTEFTLTRDIVLNPVNVQPALEVALERMTGAKHKLPESDGNQGSALDKHSLTYPKRLRVRSRALLYFLEETLSIDLRSELEEANLRDEAATAWAPTVFLWPYKLFFLREAEIRQGQREFEAGLTASTNGDTVSFKKPNMLSMRKNTGEIPLFETEDLRQDLRLLIEFMDVDLKRASEIRNCVRAGQDCEIEYQDLWHVFQPGDLIVQRHEMTHAFCLLNVAGGREPLEEVYMRPDGHRPIDGFVLDCYSISGTGTSFVPILSHFHIRHFYGRQKVSNLPYMPLKVHPEVDQLTATFNERGKAYVDITSKPFCHMMAKGRTLDEPSQDLDTQVIVDLTLALRSNEEWRIKDEISESHLTQNDTMEVSERPYCGHRYQPPGCCGSDVLHDDCELERIRSSSFILESGNIFRSLSLSEITDSHYVLVKPHVYAFVLRHRQWVTLSVSDLSPVIFSNIFDDLRIPEEHKTAVQALVRTHEAGKAQVLPGQAQSVGAALELVAGKGRGLIILLHGPPGVGKTSTAECVADNTKRPLYPITPGDIGETAAEVERNLHHHFQFAQKWGCVLLLDEADVFLTKRTKLDLRHNAVTSVFLRSLEYYSGILFLTTNRVGVMDLAFKSRIQMTLWYPKLSREVTLELYQMFINRTKKEQKDKNSYQFKIKEKEILQFAAKHFDYLEKHKLDTWNGRQIRNAFQTAIALVEHDSTMREADDPIPKLGKRQFKIVAVGSQKFDEYLTATTGNTELDAARMDKWRDDTFMGSGMETTSHRSPKSKELKADQKTLFSTARSLKVPALDDSDSSSADAADERSVFGSDSSSDNDSDQTDTDSRTGRKKQRGKKPNKADAKGQSSEKGGLEGGSGGAGPGMLQEAQFKQFLEWQKQQQ